MQELVKRFPTLDIGRLDVYTFGMSEEQARYAPGRVRDAILQVLTYTSEPLSVKQIEQRVGKVIGPTPTSSVRSYLPQHAESLCARGARGLPGGPQLSGRSPAGDRAGLRVGRASFHW